MPVIEWLFAAVIFRPTRIPLCSKTIATLIWITETTSSTAACAGSPWARSVAYSRCWPLVVSRRAARTNRPLIPLAIIRPTRLRRPLNLAASISMRRRPTGTGVKNWKPVTLYRTIARRISTHSWTLPVAGRSTTRITSMKRATSRSPTSTRRSVCVCRRANPSIIISLSRSICIISLSSIDPSTHPPILPLIISQQERHSDRGIIRIYYYRLATQNTRSPVNL